MTPIDSRAAITRWGTAILLSAAVVGLPRPTAAQSRSYAGATFWFTPWATHSVSAGSPSTSFTNSSATSMLAGLGAEAGWYFSPSGSAGVEFAWPLSRAAIAQETYYFSPSRFEGRYREFSLFGIVRGDVRAGRSVSAGVLAGAGPVCGSSLGRSARGTFGSQVFGPFGAETELTHTALGVVAGVDLTVKASRRMRVVPQFRMVMVRRGNVINSRETFATFGLPGISYRAGVGFRF